MTVIEEIADERKRQIEAEGWTPTHDDEHAHGELAGAASCYALAAQYIAEGSDTAAREKALASRAPDVWPFPIKWWKPRDQRRNLVRAAALIVAEIERIDRRSLYDQQRGK